MRSTSGGLDVEDEESEAEDSESEGRDYSWKKTIMIGPTYQSNVPADLSHYGDTLPYGKKYFTKNASFFTERVYSLPIKSYNSIKGGLSDSSYRSCLNAIYIVIVVSSL